MVFTTLAFISLIVFTANISFHKKRLDFRELMPSWAIMMLKLLYPLMLGINAWVLWNVSSPLLADWAGLLGTCLGGGIVWKARRDLGAAHTWVGYCRDQDEFVQSGIYRHIRHPLYTGIGVYIFSAGTTIALHGHWLSAGTYFLLSTLTLIFLALSARKEEKALNNRIGEEYRKYIGEVGALFPKLALMQTLKTYVTRFCKKQSGAAKRYIIFLSVLQCCLTVHAGGVNRVSGLGPRGGAMSGSYTAIADDASLFYYNVAGLAEIDGTLAEAHLDCVRPQFTVHRSGFRTKRSLDNAVYPLPLAAYVTTAGNIGYGVGIYVPFGLGASFEDNPEQLGYDTKTLLSLTHISPGVGVRVSDRLSLGATLNVGYGQFRYLAPLSLGKIVVPVGTDNKADGLSLGGSVGLMWHPTDTLSFGCQYISGASVHAEGETTIMIGPFRVHDDMHTLLSFPRQISTGFAVQISPQWQVSSQFVHFGYSKTPNDMVLSFQKLGINKRQRMAWHDDIGCGIGASFSPSEKWTFRAGVGYQSAAVPESTLSTLTPDCNGWDVSLGIERRYGATSVSGNMVYAWGKSTSAAYLRQETLDVSVIGVGFGIQWKSS